MEGSVSSILKEASRRQLRQCRLLSLGFHLGGLCVLLGGLQVLESCHSLPELVFGLGVPALCLAVSLSCLVWCFGILPRRFSPSSVALGIERRHPELKDALNCGLELEARGSLNELESAVVSGARDTLVKAGGTYASELLHPGRLPMLVMALTVLTALAAGLLCMRGGRKAWYWLADRWTGEDSGLTILSPSREDSFTTHGDVKVRVRVNRWERQPVLHSFDETGRPMSFPMHVEEGGEAVGVLYDVAECVRYRVTTPSLGTDWRIHKVCDRPELTQVSLRTVPQAYTGLKPQELSALGEVSVVSGDGLVLEVVCAGGGRLRLRHGGVTVPLRMKGQKHRVDWVAVETGEDWVLAADDVQGKEQELGRFTVRVRPDLPPEIERQAPKGDVSIHERDGIRLHGIARDDFGLRSCSLRYRVAGKAGEEMSLSPEEPGGREWEWNELWDVSSLKLSAGDVVTCVLVARDNCPPRGQESRSEVFFVSIVPDLKEIEAAGPSGKEETQVDLSDLLAESKRLLRLTYDLQGYGEVPEEGLSDLAGGLGDLQLEIGRREIAIMKKAGAERLPEPLHGLFRTARDKQGEALELVRNGRLRDSMAPQEMSLGALSRLVADMMRNKAKSDKAQEGKEAGEGASADQQKQGEMQERQGQADKAEEEARTLSQAVTRLRELIEGQEALNRLYGREDESLRGELSRGQRKVRRGTRELEQSLLEVKAARKVRDELSGAIGEMTGAESGIQRGDLTGARLRGLRAVQGLRDGLEALERVQRDSNRRQVEALSRALSDLARRQRGAAEVSRGLAEQKSRGEDDREGRSRARKEQEAIRRGTELLREGLGRVSESLEPSAPEGASALRELSRELGAEAIVGGQRKALNGLLYRRYERAASEQERAGAALSGLSGRLSEVVSQLPSYSGSDLRRQLSRLEADMRSVRSAQRRGEGAQGHEALSSARRESSRDILSLGQMLKDRELEESGRLSGKDGGSSVSSEGDALLRQLRRAVEVGSRRLSELEGKEQMRFRRSQVYPPDKYRRLVEEYFKALSE